MGDQHGDLLINLSLRNKLEQSLMWLRQHTGDPIPHWLYHHLDNELKALGAE